MRSNVLKISYAIRGCHWYTIKQKNFIALSIVELISHAIHGIQNMSPRWNIKNFENRGARMVHFFSVIEFVPFLHVLLLHSVITVYSFRICCMICKYFSDYIMMRNTTLKEDTCDGPAMPIRIKVYVFIFGRDDSCIYSALKFECLKW